MGGSRSRSPCTTRRGAPTACSSSLCAPGASHSSLRLPRVPPTRQQRRSSWASIWAAALSMHAVRGLPAPNPDPDPNPNPIPNPNPTPMAAVRALAPTLTLTQVRLPSETCLPDHRRHPLVPLGRHLRASHARSALRHGAAGAERGAAPRRSDRDLARRRAVHCRLRSDGRHLHLPRASCCPRAHTDRRSRPRRHRCARHGQPAAGQPQR